MTLKEREKSLHERQRGLLEVSLALSSESNLQTLLEKIVEEAKHLTSAEGGTFYSVKEGQLVFEIVRNDRLKIEQMPLEPIPLLLEGRPNLTRVITTAVNERRTVTIDDVYQDYKYCKSFDEKSGYRTQAVLAVPICNQHKEVIAVLQLVNPHDPDRFTEDDVKLAQSFASMAGVAITNRQLIDDLRSLLYSLTRTIAEAIDERGHEERVPVIALMLAEAVNKEREGPFSQLELTPEQLEELRLAAYLHDCGKIGVPQHLLNKRTKLEGVYDKIEWIKERIRDPSDIAFLELVNIGEAYDRERIEKMEGLLADEKERLLVERGNLTQSERRLVEQHVERTFRMLSHLRFPKDLERVPEIAVSHHERMDGTGYPRGLKGEEIPFRGRILAVADVFEALSSPSRSYKKPWKLSHVMEVMRKMADEGHLDPELVDVFFKQNVHLDYARAYLSPDQNDL